MKEDKYSPDWAYLKRFLESGNLEHFKEYKNISGFDYKYRKDLERGQDKE